tara:strand:- start:184 stop:855 length:672 start_codon:yes stop_codon:yes gene_type:complete
MYKGEMDLTFKELQPYRLWFQYLQTALNDPILSKKVSQSYYKEWHLNQVKTKSFNQWIKTHERLFINEEVQEIKLFKGSRTPNTVAVEIPINFTVQRIQVEIGKAVKGLVAKQQASQSYKLSIKRPLQSAPLDWFHWAWQFKQDPKNYTLHEIWDLVNNKQDKRQVKVKKRKDARSLQRNLSTAHAKKIDRSKQILMSRNIAKATKILNNVVKGIFPGDYSDH